MSNGVPVFAEPPVKNARLTLTLICSILGVLLGGIAFLAHAYHTGAMNQQQPGYQSVISQLATAVAGRGILYYVTIGSVLTVLTLSANTSFADFPRLCRLLADDYFLPRSFATLGRRLVYSYGIGILAILSALLLTAFDGITDRLIPLFAVGAFGAFTFSQAGMVVHWKRKGRRLCNPSLLINAVGAVTTGAALLVIIMAKFTEGAWITLIVIPGLATMFAGIRKNYARILSEKRPPLKLETWNLRPPVIVIPISGWNRVAEESLRFALELSGEITAVHVSYEPTNETLQNQWEHHVQEPASKAGFPEPNLQILYSPFRRFFSPLVKFVAETEQANPGRIIAVILPELVHPRWWEYLLHNHAAAVLKALLLMNSSSVVIIATPWRMRKE